ncbi:class I SAM-dependent methyltransferase [Plantactinospora solaniradicis]|uniref:Class I SAM-dependent methyltransferase n=1 Tax=Plantactinospora solaniradicis TaxID=1723736 RepID=A0ABW1KH39_9ACTN
MAGERMPVPAWQAMTDEQARRWAEILGHLAGALPAGAVSVVVDGAAPHAGVVADRLAPMERWYISESRAFFAVRAASWDARFGDDMPACAAAVAEANLRTGGVAVDLGCGTGRALPALRDAVGRHGIVIGVDITPQMLAVARDQGRTAGAGLILGDARHLPIADACVDAVFAAGLLGHLPDPEAGLHELARITRPGGRLVLFHPSGRAALAARHGHTLHPDEPLAEIPLRRSTDHTGWHLTSYDDPVHRFLAIGIRR